MSGDREVASVISKGPFNLLFLGHKFSLFGMVVMLLTGAPTRFKVIKAD
jgi:hypothetical protein